MKNMYEIILELKTTLNPHYIFVSSITDFEINFFAIKIKQ